MNLIKCKECGKELSSKAEICPNCGIRIHKIKRIVIFCCSIIAVLLIVWVFLINGGISNTIDVLQGLNEETKHSAFEGKWELVGNSSDYKEMIASELNLESENVSLYSTLNIQTVAPYGSGSNMGALYNAEEDFVVAIIGDKDGFPIVACFKLENNYLVQIEKEIFAEEIKLSKNINLKYQENN